MKNSLVIAIAGGSASGKSSVANMISDSFVKTKSVCTICYDDYYRDQSNLSMEERICTNYDHPSAFDLDLFLNHLEDLKIGVSVKKPIYDFTIHNRSNEYEVIEPSDVYVVEGLFVLSEPSIRDLCDVLVYVDTDADIRFLRRIKRDVLERNRTLDSVCDQYLETVRVMHDMFVEPSKKVADIIIPRGIDNKVAIDLLCTKINTIIDKN